MPAPLLIPLILLGGATIALAASSAKKKKAPPSGNVTTYTLDANMPPGLRDQVLAALSTEQDPSRLEAFAAALMPTYPLSATALRMKAAMLRGGTMPQNPIDMLVGVPDPPRTQVIQQLMGQNDPNALEAYARQLEAQYPAAAAALRMKEAILRGQVPQVQPPAPPPLPTPPPRPIPPDPPPIFPPQPPPGQNIPELAGLPEPLRTQVYQALTTGTDPDALEALARQCDAQYPTAAWALRAKEAMLRAQTPPPAPSPSPSPQPQPPPSPPPIFPQPPSPAPAPPNVPQYMPVLDPGMPPEMQKAVVGALTTENDPAKLEGFASAIQAQYPIASGLLMAKAQALRLAHGGIPQVPVPPIPRPPAPPPPAPTGPALFPIGDDSTRTGRNAGRPVGKWPFVVLGTRGPGNAPVVIAKHGAGSENEYMKLQPLNPQYRIGREPEWVGQALNVPWEWAPRLVGAGYDVKQDPGAVPPGGSIPTFDAPKAPPALPQVAMKGGLHAPHA